jgi:CRISPR-associated endonuclease Csn1
MQSEGMIFAFDVGKASLGICVREGEHLHSLQSLLIPAEFGMTSDFRARRRAMRTRNAHKKREAWLCKLWQEAGLTPLGRDDERLKREFPAKGDDTICNSALLRIALLQDRKLDEWQIFKALWSAIQLRGYETVAWAGNAKKKKDANTKASDEPDVVELSASERQAQKEEQENLEQAQKYQEWLQYAITPHLQYEYPCFLEASRMGLWSSESPETFKLRIDHNAKKVRRKAGHDNNSDPGNTAPRSLVEKEIQHLWEKAQQQLRILHEIPSDYLLYGPAQKPYASYEDPAFYGHRGTEWDAQGVLSQKIPRFDNRIINKCQLLPKRNVCKASDSLNVEQNLLKQLKDLRFTVENDKTGQSLKPRELKIVFELCQENLAKKKSLNITSTQLLKFVRQATDIPVHSLNMSNKDQLKINTSGRARFCRPALTIMNQILLEGLNPPEFDITPYIQEGQANGITRDELEKMRARLGADWEHFHVADKRYEKHSGGLSIQERADAIVQTIGAVNNPIVRHRLTFFWNELKSLTQQFGEPRNVILEFVRGDEGLEGQKTANDWERHIKENEKRNDRIREQLNTAQIKGHKWNIERFRLAEEQQWRCPYTNEALSVDQLEYYQVDHIVPMSGDIVTDAFYNKVLCTQQANQDKRNRTPYEWLSHTDAWPDYLARITDKNSSYSQRKKELLTREDARDLVESYNGLAETAYIARLGQQIVALYFGWGLQTSDDTRRVFVNDGRTTAKIRKIYDLNELLLSDEEKEKLKAARGAGQQRTVWKKNRENPKHHALDAYCISYSQKLKASPPDHAGRIHWSVPGLMESKAEMEKRLKGLFPQNTRRNTKELYPMETIYGYRKRMENGKKIHYLTVRKGLVDYLTKDWKQAKDKEKVKSKLKNILDTDIQADLQNRLADIEDPKAWRDLLEKGYKHPTRHGNVNNILIIESRSEDPPQIDAKGRMTFGEFKDFGNLDTHGGAKGITPKQFKHSKQHLGQVIYFDAQNKPRVFPMYAHQKKQDALNELRAKGLKLYNNGEVYYSGCTIHLDHDLVTPKTRFSAGLYKLRTIKTKGTAILEDSQGIEILTSIKQMMDAKFKLAKRTT